MPKFVQVLIFATLGFVIAAVVGYFLVSTLSSNRHDLSLEAAMTSMFVIGPAGAIVGAIWAYLRTKSS
jgi:predicted PurR-regulated permease PerM